MYHLVVVPGACSVIRNVAVFVYNLCLLEVLLLGGIDFSGALLYSIERAYSGQARFIIPPPVAPIAA